MKRRILLLSLSRALNIRNFLLYDFYAKALSTFDEVHVLTDFAQQEGFRRQFKRDRVVFHTVPVLKRSIPNLLRKAILRYDMLARLKGFYELPYTSMFIKGKRFNWPSRPWWQRFMVGFWEWLGAIRLWRSSFEAFRRWLFAPSEYRQLLRTNEPSVVMTSYVPHHGELPEEFLIGSCQKEQVPVVSHVSGVDNLTLKAPFYAEPNYVVVWNHLMRDHAEGIYRSLGKDQVLIAPPPQFDIYGQPAQLLDRDGLYQALGFSNELRARKLVTFISNGGVNYVNPNDELDIFERLYERIQASEWRDRVVFFIRLSATRNEDEWNRRLAAMTHARTRAVTMAHSNRRASVPWNSEPLDPIFLQSLVRHSAVLVSACSTLTLDACLCDVPSVCIAFDGHSKAESFVQSMIRKPVEDHFLPLTLMGATRFALNEQDLYEHVSAALQNPSQDAAARAKARAFYFADLIGKPHEDTVDILKRLADSHATSEAHG